MMASTSASVSDGAEVTVLTRSAATRISRSEQDREADRGAQRDHSGAAVAALEQRADRDDDGDDDADAHRGDAQHLEGGGDGAEEGFPVHVARVSARSGPRAPRCVFGVGELRLQDSNLVLTAPKAVVLPLHQGGWPVHKFCQTADPR